MRVRSTPAAPVVDTIMALRGGGFEDIVRARNCSGLLGALKPSAPAVSENILLCGMAAVGARRSWVLDRQPPPARGLFA